MKSVVVFDSHYLCWRGFYTTSRLSHNGNATGVLYAFLRDIITMNDLFAPDVTVFCFEGGGDRLREQVYPEYKKNRIKILTQEEAVARDNLKVQINTLRDDVLPNMGFKNVFAQNGYEADDIIATICHDNPETDITIVSGDSDLYQLLTKKVRVYNPRDKSIVSRKVFARKYGIKPQQWALVKAMSGDKSDNIPGIKGIGEVNAIRYINGNLKTTSTNFKKIKSGGDLIRRNLRLVELPFENCAIPKLIQHDPVDLQAWSKMLERFGITSLKPKEEHRGEQGSGRTEGFKI